MKNVALIGMPASGKSTIGLLLAKSTGMAFVDTDLLVQQREGLLLQQIIDSSGIKHFLRVEESVTMGLAVHRHVIATGGSVIYNQGAVEHLLHNGTLIYLKVGCEELLKRLTNPGSRGIVINAGQTFEDLYRERTPLYEKYACFTVDCSAKAMESIVAEIVEFLA